MSAPIPEVDCENVPAFEITPPSDNWNNFCEYPIATTFNETLLSPANTESVSTSLSSSNSLTSRSSSLSSDGYECSPDTSNPTSYIECYHDDQRQTMAECIHPIISEREEIRRRIRLKKIDRRHEKLKVEFTEQETEIFYSAVHKRNEIKEKNKEYARQSRYRLKHKKEHLEEEYIKLKRQNEVLKENIAKLEEKFAITRKSLQVHHMFCPVCSEAGRTCSVCISEMIE